MPPRKPLFSPRSIEKGESPEEIAGFVEQLIDRAIDPGIDPASLPGPMIDVCGTGGAGLGILQRLHHDHVYSRRRRSGGGEAWQPQCHLVLRERGCARSARAFAWNGRRKNCGNASSASAWVLSSRAYIIPLFGLWRRCGRSSSSEKQADDFQSARPAAQSGAPAAAAHRSLRSAPDDVFRGGLASTRTGTRLDRSWHRRKRSPAWTTFRPAARPLSRSSPTAKSTSAVIDCRWLGIPEGSLADLARRRRRGECANAHRNPER